MASFYNLEMKKDVRVMYISSSRKGRVVLKAPGYAKPGNNMMRLRRQPGVNQSDGPEVLVANGKGVARREPTLDPLPGHYCWSFSDLTNNSTILAIDERKNILAQFQVQTIDLIGSYKWIMKRLTNPVRMSIDLDSHIDYICDASDDIGYGIHFRPKDSEKFKAAILETQLFHHDNRADPVGALAAKATIGEGYREVSTPSLHVAISDFISSIHIDSHAFLLTGANGQAVITPDVGQHIFDELLFRMPMPWLKSNVPFLASVLNTLHPILPNSTNGYSSIVGLRFELGGPSSRDLRTGMARFMFESTVDFGRGSKDRIQHQATLRIVNGGKRNQAPDWVLSMKAHSSCLTCDKQPFDSVGLYFTTTR